MMCYRLQGNTLLLFINMLIIHFSAGCCIAGWKQQGCRLSGGRGAIAPGLVGNGASRRYMTGSRKQFLQ